MAVTPFMVARLSIVSVMPLRQWRVLNRALGGVLVNVTFPRFKNVLPNTTIRAKVVRRGMAPIRWKCGEKNRTKSKEQNQDEENTCDQFPGA